MPSYEEHIMQAEHNEEMLAFLEEHDKHIYFSDWYVTTAFYTALHYYEAMIFATKLTIGGITVQDSGTLCRYFDTDSERTVRKNVIKSHYSQLHKSYSYLYRGSRLARYNCYATDRHEWDLAKKYLGDVKIECKRLIANKIK
jgi:hypothetical protein